MADAEGDADGAGTTDADGRADPDGDAVGGDEASADGVGDGVAHAASRLAVAMTTSGRRSGFIGDIVSRWARVARQP